MISVYLKHKVHLLRTVVPLKIDIDQGYKRSDAKDTQMGWSPFVGRHWRLLHVFMYKNIFLLCKENKPINIIKTAK